MGKKEEIKEFYEKELLKDTGVPFDELNEQHIKEIKYYMDSQINFKTWFKTLLILY